MLFHNENTSEGIECVMEEINKYVPYLLNKELLVRELLGTSYRLNVA